MARLYLKQWRKRAGKTQEKVAEELGTTKGTISRYEKGTRQPRQATREALAKSYGCRIQDLYSPPPPDDSGPLTPDDRDRILKRLKTVLETE